MRDRTVIIGAGPAGLFCALALAEEGGRDIVVVEQGKDLDERIGCSESRGESASILAGFGGAGAFSDGKLTISTEVGGYLNELIETEKLSNILKDVDATYLSLGAPARIYGGESDRLRKLRITAQRADLELIETRIRHIGTDGCLALLNNLRERLLPHIELRTEIKAEEIVVEVPAAVTKELTDAAYEAKLVYYSKTFDDRVRTFCMNPYGEVIMEKAGELITVNGHSYRKRRSENTNFALLVSTTFTEPFDDPISYGRHIGALANLLGKGIIVQRLGDLHEGRRSTASRIAKSIVHPTLKEATPGDLSFVLPYRYLKDITEMLEALDSVAPGINSGHTLLYGVEVKFYSHRLKLSPSMETGIKNLFAAGDGAGITRGLLQASASGLIAGKEIASRIKGR